MLFRVFFYGHGTEWGIYANAGIKALQMTSSVDCCKSIFVQKHSGIFPTKSQILGFSN